MKDFFKLRESMSDFTNRDYKPGATDQEKRNAIKRKRADVEEGTWAIPETPKQKKELKNILKKPLPAGKDGDNASDKMYSIIGDDELFDDFYVAGKKNPKADVRPLIKKAMKRLGIKEEFEEVDEGIKHDRYMRAHGKKAPSKEIATWMFTTKEMGDVDDNDKKVVWRAKQPMKLAQAGKEAMKALGTKDVYVMESTNVNEATDIYTKDAFQVTRYSMGKGQLGFQFNYGKPGRYIQVAKKDLGKLAKAVQAAMKDKMNEEGGAGLFGTTALRRKYEDETPGQGQNESSASWAKSLETIARKRQFAQISDKDKATLIKIADMLAKEKKK